MSIKGIDAQIMVTRTADYTKDTSALQRRNEMTSDYLAVQQKTADVQETQKVIKSLESEDVRLQRDDGEGGGGGTGGGRSGSQKDRTDEEEQLRPGMVVLSEERKIDIKI